MPPALAIGYVRVSTEGQASEGVSLEAQKAKIEAWCTVHDRTLGGLFVDAGVSGKRADNRPELQKALDAVCQRRRGTRPLAQGTHHVPLQPVLVVYSLSRLARSTRDAIQIAERLEKSGADLVSLTEDLNTTSAAGKMLFRLLAVFAEFERDLISERTSSALQHMRNEGKRVGAVPFGFDLAGDGETLVESAREQTTIVQMIAWRNEGLTLREIVKRLSSRRIRSKQGLQWHPKTVRDVIFAARSRPKTSPATS